MTTFCVHRFIKAGKREHIESLLKLGKVYMNTLEYYRGIDNNDEIGDIFEGVNKLIPFSNILINFGNNSWETIDTQYKSPLGYYNSCSNLSNVFCMYGIFDEDKRSLKEHQEVTCGFGESTLLIFNPKEFIKRIKEECLAKGLEFFCSRVQYYDENNPPKNISPFNKRDKYAHQKEIRILIKNTNNKPMVLHLGSIEDIATII